MESKSRFTLTLLTLTPIILWAQMVFETAAKLAASNATFALNCDFINNSAEADFSDASIITTGPDQLLSSVSATVRGLVIDGGGIKTLKGGWFITSELRFLNGIVVPSSTGLTGDIAYKGLSQPLGNQNSYVRGWFHDQGTGTRFFPIGNQSGYFPAFLSDVADPSPGYGMEVVEQSPQLSLPISLTATVDRYWHLVSGSLQVPSLSTIGLSIRENSFSSLRNSEVLAGRFPGDMSVDLGNGSITQEFIVSAESILPYDAIYTYAVGPEVKLIIHNMITPSAEGKDAKLHIENIQFFPNNIVTLVNRWGGEVHSWTSFTNDDESFDFTSLSAGNYVCIVEYSDSFGRSQVSQVITILK